jgi:hypothetical protein
VAATDGVVVHTDDQNGDPVNLKRNTAVIVAAATVGALGIGGVVAANADNGSAPQHQVTTHHAKSDGDGEVPDSQEGSDGETNDDATDTGPDANPNEPGHQDASDAQGGEKADGDGEVPDAQEGSDGETNDDATDTGPDANPNEPGHQDASDTQGDGDGEVPDSQE